MQREAVGAGEEVLAAEVDLVEVAAAAALAEAAVEAEVAALAEVAAVEADSAAAVEVATVAAAAASTEEVVASEVEEETDSPPVIIRHWLCAFRVKECVSLY